MKIVTTGSLGHIGKPLVEKLLKNKHEVTVISSSSAKQKDIEKLGATAAIGSLEDVNFLTATLKGADAFYCMVPPNNYFDQDLDLLAYYRTLGTNYAQAIKRSEVKHVVNLSSIGAHLEKGNGILRGAHDVEQILNKLPEKVSVVHMRPTSFYYNLYGYTDMIKTEGVIAANYGGEDLIPWVSPFDIASAIAEEITSQKTERKVRYVASEDLTGTETAKILGIAIEKPDLKWILISDEETLNGLKAIGMNPDIAAGLVEMYAGLHSGLLSEDYRRNKPAIMGQVKLKDFAKEFAASYN
ncbi:MAG: NAD(P)H-binding protein [Leeuwenhoekiella sp.]